MFLTARSWAAGRRFIVPPLAASGALCVARRPAPAVALLAAAGALALAVRDPERACPAAADIIYSAADGRVTNAGNDDTLRWRPDLGTVRVGVFLSLRNVHVVRAPAAGTVLDMEDVYGKYKPAWSARAAEENRRVRLVIGTGRGPVGVVWTAGLVARRVIPWVAAGTALAAGERGAIIVFGSRAELVLPDGFVPIVQEGDRVVAGVTPVARWSGHAQAGTASQSCPGMGDRCAS